MSYTAEKFQEIIEKIKDEISNDIEGKVFNYHIANALKITTAALSTRKNRDSIPYDEIILFCVERKISVNWLIFNQGEKFVSGVKK